MIPEIGVEILKEGLIPKTNKLGTSLVKTRDFNGRSELISDLVKFYINLSDLNNNKMTKDLFQQKKAG